MSEVEPQCEALTSELVFRRLDELREFLRLTEYLKGFRPLAAAGPVDPQANSTDAEARLPKP